VIVPHAVVQRERNQHRAALRLSPQDPDHLPDFGEWRNWFLYSAEVVLKHLDAKLETLGANADAALTDMRGLLADAKKVLAKIDAEVEPLAASGTLDGVDRAVAGDSRVGAEALRALRDVADAARSLKALATLSRATRKLCSAAREVQKANEGPSLGVPFSRWSLSPP